MLFINHASKSIYPSTPTFDPPFRTGNNGQRDKSITEKIYFNKWGWQQFQRFKSSIITVMVKITEKKIEGYLTNYLPNCENFAICDNLSKNLDRIFMSISKLWKTSYSLVNAYSFKCNSDISRYRVYVFSAWNGKLWFHL